MSKQKETATAGTVAENKMVIEIFSSLEHPNEKFLGAIGPYDQEEFTKALELFQQDQEKIAQHDCN